MSRLSQDREEREAQLREYEHDLGSRSSRRNTTSTLNTPTTTASAGSKITIGHILLGIVGVVIAVKVLPFVFWWVVSALIIALHEITVLAIIAGIGYLGWRWYKSKYRRV